MYNGMKGNVEEAGICCHPYPTLCQSAILPPKYIFKLFYSVIYSSKCMLEQMFMIYWSYLALGKWTTEPGIITCAALAEEWNLFDTKSSLLWMDDKASPPCPKTRDNHRPMQYVVT